jgi:hypothetical protein
MESAKPATGLFNTHVVELIDETDELVGYAVCVETTTRLDERTTQTDYTVRPEVYGTRSEAHAAIEEARKVASAKAMEGRDPNGYPAGMTEQSR